MDIRNQLTFDWLDNDNGKCERGPTRRPPPAIGVYSGNTRSVPPTIADGPVRAEALDIGTALVAHEQLAGRQQDVIPSAAVVYGYADAKVTRAAHPSSSARRSPSTAFKATWSCLRTGPPWEPRSPRSLCSNTHRDYRLVQCGDT